MLIGEKRSEIADIELLLHAGWDGECPGLMAGTTVGPEDYGLAGPDTAWATTSRFEALAHALGCKASVVCRQVHGSRVILVDRPPFPGVCIAGDADGLASDESGVLLTVTVADCVPVFMVDPESRAIALLHAGWRGAAAGIVKQGIRALQSLTGASPSGLWIHMGPAICESCYEVGPDVLREFGRPARNRGKLDLRAWLTEDAARLGVRRESISVSSWCTSCSSDLLHSYRRSGQTAGRMAAFLGWRLECG
ncbi:MAG: polyphenol oxidase family protein [Gemmatimonadota bacterium]